MKKIQYAVAVLVLLLVGCGSLPVNVQREFSVSGTTVTDGQITVSIGDEVLKSEEKLRVIQSEDLQKNLITRMGNRLAGIKVRRSVKLDVAITGFMHRTGMFRHGETNISCLVTLSEDGKQLESFDATGYNGNSIAGAIDSLTNSVIYKGAKNYKESEPAATSAAKTE